MKTKNNNIKGADYEAFIKEIVRLFNKNTFEGVETQRVERNAVLTGNSNAKHQIDILWVYKKDGKTHRTAIECKCHSKPICKGIVTSFYGVIADLPNVNGVIVTTSGYQAGAQRYALFYGIKLFVVNKNSSNNSGSRISDLMVRTFSSSFKLNSLSVYPKPVPNNAKGIQCSRIDIDVQQPLDSLKIKSDGCSFTLLDLIRNRSNHQYGIALKEVVSFDDAKITIPLSAEKDLAKFKCICRNNNDAVISISRIEYDYDLSKHEETAVIYGREVIKAFVSEFNKNDIYVIRWDGKLIELEPEYKHTATVD